MTGPTGRPDRAWGISFTVLHYKTSEVVFWNDDDTGPVIKSFRCRPADDGLRLYRILDRPRTSAEVDTGEEWRAAPPTGTNSSDGRRADDAVRTVVTDAPVVEGRLFRCVLVNEKNLPRAAGEIWMEVGESGWFLMTDGLVVPVAPRRSVSEFFQTAPEKVSRLVVQLKDLPTTRLVLSIHEER